MLHICTGIVTSINGKWLFPRLKGANYHTWAVQMTALLHSKGFWMYLEKTLPVATGYSYDLECLKKIKTVQEKIKN
jgi:hypothetical protein